MNAISQMKLFRHTVLGLERSVQRLDEKWYQSQKIMESALNEWDLDIGVLLDKLEALFDLPIIEINDEDASPLELEAFTDNLVNIYPDFANALIMLYNAMVDVLVPKNSNLS